MNEKKNKGQITEHEKDFFNEDNIEIKNRENQKKSNGKTSFFIDFFLSMDSYKHLFILAFTAARGGISEVIFYYYSDYLGTYYEHTDGKKLKKENVKDTLKPTFFSILGFVCGNFDRYIFEYMREKLS